MNVPARTGRRGQSDAEGAADQRRVLQRAEHGGHGSSGQKGVRVEEEEHLPAGDGRARVHLRRPPPRCVDHGVGPPARDLHRAVTALPVGDDHLARPRLPARPDRAGDRRLLVQRGDDHRNPGGHHGSPPGGRSSRPLRRRFRRVGRKKETTRSSTGKSRSSVSRSGRPPVRGEDVPHRPHQVGEDEDGREQPQHRPEEVVAEPDPGRPGGVVEDDEGEPEDPQVEDHREPLIGRLPVEPRHPGLEETAGDPVKEVLPQVEGDRGPEHIRREVVQHPVELAEDHGARDGERGGGEEENPEGVDQDEDDGPQRPRGLDQRVQTPDQGAPPFRGPEEGAGGSEEHDIRDGGEEKQKRRELEDVPAPVFTHAGALGSCRILHHPAGLWVVGRKGAHGGQGCVAVTMKSLRIYPGRGDGHAREPVREGDRAGAGGGGGGALRGVLRQVPVDRQGVRHQQVDRRQVRPQRGDVDLRHRSGVYRRGAARPDRFQRDRVLDGREPRRHPNR